MEKAIQKDSFRYKDDVIRVTKKEQGNSEKITDLFIDSNNINDKVTVLGIFTYIISINPDRQIPLTGMQR